MAVTDTAGRYIGLIEERDKVTDWRSDQLERAGYSLGDANELAARAHADVDLHAAVALLGRGCSVATALRILL